MISTVTLALFYSASAGIINGSFALPTKHIKTWNFENIWFNYAIWAFLILPWTTIFMLDARIGEVYANISRDTWFILLIGGFLFGIGQVCFALALRTIGLGLGFVINIGLGAGLGSLLPLLTLDQQQFFTPVGILTLIGVALIIVGLVLSYSAGRQRDKILQSHPHMTNNSIKKSVYRLSVVLAVLAGLFSAGQNITFSLTHHLQQMALTQGIDSLAVSILIWPPFLTCSLIPYAAYMFYLHTRNNSFNHYYRSGFLRNSILGIVMASS